jgi:hypothetical protein
MSELELAEREHAEATVLIASAVGGALDSSWHAARQGRSWTPAEELSHVLLALEFGARAAEGTMQMRLQRSALVSALSRAVLIPLLLRSGGFPSGGRAPDELDPLRIDRFRREASDRESALLALGQAADRTAAAFVHAAQHVPHRRIVHAYFGGLTLLTGWRLLSAHTRHHAALLEG